LQNVGHEGRTDMTSSSSAIKITVVIELDQA
jgi:hypothetical protein